MLTYHLEFGAFSGYMARYGPLYQHFSDIYRDMLKAPIYVNISSALWRFFAKYVEICYHILQFGRFLEDMLIFFNISSLFLAFLGDMKKIKTYVSISWLFGDIYGCMLKITEIC